MEHKESLNDLVSSIASGAASATQQAEQALHTCEQLNPHINALTTIAQAQALEQARSIDSLSASEKQSLPLCGVPVVVKDNIVTKGIHTTCSSAMLAEFNPPYDAHVVECLKKAGAVIIAKANLDEFAMGSSTETSNFGPTKNPVDPTRVPGGSSGGSAAAVACGMSSVSLGSDTGGSIRQPAAFCGVLGLKPTYGRVSRYGLVAFASSLDQIGPFATSVDDLGLMLQVISAADNRDATNAGKPFVYNEAEVKKPVAKLRVGWPSEFFEEGLQDSVRSSIMLAKEQLLEQGATFVDISLPRIKASIATYYIICTAEASSNLARYDGVRYGHRSEDAQNLEQMFKLSRTEAFGDEVKRRIMLGTYVLSSGYYDAYYKKAAQVRTLIRQDFARAFEQCDVIMGPTTPNQAFVFGENANDPLQMYLNDIYTVSANLAGLPAVSIPGKEQNALPVGIQCIAPQWQEQLLLRCANALAA